MLTPVIVPSIITAIAMYYLAGKLGLIGNFAVARAVPRGDRDADRAADPVGGIARASIRTWNARHSASAAAGCACFCRVVLPIALPGVLSAALFAFLASFDELLISLFLAGVRAQTLPVRIWNSLNLQVEPTIAAVSAFLIAVTTLILAAEAILRHRLVQRRRRAAT